jgi:hypothetical protein
METKDEHPELDNEISEKDFWRNITYHESAHTALSYLTKRHSIQITNHRILHLIWNAGWSPINFFSQFIYWEMSDNEKVFYALAWLAMQDLLKSKKIPSTGTEILEEHRKIWWIKQWDIIYAIKIARKKLKRVFDQDCWNEDIFIDVSITKIKDFISKEPRLKKFIARLSYLNQKQKLLSPKDISEASKYAGISDSERRRLRSAINELDLLDVSNLSSRQPSAE